VKWNLLYSFRLTVNYIVRCLQQYQSRRAASIHVSRAYW